MNCPAETSDGSTLGEIDDRVDVGRLTLGSSSQHELVLGGRPVDEQPHPLPHPALLGARHDPLLRAHEPRCRRRFTAAGTSSSSA